ncbi:MAG: hypothetical protein CL916_13910 [Deltaproteobacteria bacterium]|nr:hypothetical protein [Deltaproteobacteria bacterium]
MNSLIYLLASLCAFTFGYRIYRHKKRFLAARSYMLLCAVTGIAFLGFSVYLISGEFWFRVVFYSSASFVSPCLLLFLHKWDQKTETPKWMWYTNAGIVAVYVATDLIFRENTYETSFPEGFVSLCFLGGLLYCGRYLWHAMKKEEENPIRQERLRHLLILFGITIIALGTEGLLRAFIAYDAPSPLNFLARSESLQGLAPPVSASFCVLFLYVLYLNVTLTRLVDLYELFARLSATAFFALLLTTLISLTLYLGYDSNIHIAFHLMLVLILFLSLYPLLQQPIQQVSTQFFNRPGKQLHTALFEIEQSLPNLLSVDELESTILTRMHETGRCAITSLYLWDHDQGVFVRTKHLGNSTQDPIPHVAKTPFLESFSINKLVREEDLITPEQIPARHIMESMQAQICLPIWSEQMVIGWIALKPTPWSDGFSRDERKALLRVVEQIARSLDTIRSIDKLKEQHRLAALGTMSAGLAHEIRNPLAGIKGAAQFLQDQNQDEVHQEFLQLIVSETDRLNVVVSQFLNYARPLKLQLEPYSINDLINNVLELERANHKNVDVSYTYTPKINIEEFSFDPNLLHQVILNLLQNAAQAMEYNGNIHISSSIGQLVYAPYQGQPSVEIKISDTGPGIPKETQKKLFIPFFTTKDNGTGLGLAISQRIVEAHNGNISVKSNKGKGTTFVISLPILLVS